MADPAITDETIASAVKWAVVTIGSILSLLGGILGVNKLAEVRMRRSNAAKDKKKEIADINQGKLIDGDQAALEMFKERLILLENRVDTQNTTILESAKITAEQAAHITHLTEDKDRLQTQNDRLRAELKEQRDGMMQIMLENLTKANLLLEALTAKILAAPETGQ